MMSIREVAETCFLPQGEYTLSLLAPKGTPSHRIIFELKDGIYQAEVITEHGHQWAKQIVLGERKIAWTQLGGTPGTEVFRYEMEIFPGNVLVGKAYRIDVPAEEGPASPVVAEAVK